MKQEHETYEVPNSEGIEEEKISNEDEKEKIIKNCLDDMDHLSTKEFGKSPDSGADRVLLNEEDIAVFYKDN